METTILSAVTSRQLCLDAIFAWSKARLAYNNLEPYFEQNSSFVFDETFTRWIEPWMLNGYFHSYIGLLDDQLLLICVPLDPDGNEADLDGYFTVPLETLTDIIDLTETITTTIVEWSTIDKDMVVKKQSTVLPQSYQASSEITTDMAAAEIQRWVEYGADWLYKETLSETNSISRAYQVPLSDALVLEKNKVRHCLFAMKWVPALKQMIMTFVFVEVSCMSDSDGEVFDNNTIQTNCNDFARPCPPFCRTGRKFALL